MTRSRRSRSKSRPAVAPAVAAAVTTTTVDSRATRGWRWPAVIVACAIIAFLPALTVPFYFDDTIAIEHNDSIRQLVPLSVPLNPPRNTSVAGRPLVNLSLALNYAINARLGIDQSPASKSDARTVGYHAFSLLVHACCALLLFGVVRRTLRHLRADDPEFVAGAAALLWAVHPIHSQAVLYAIARTELLVSLFLLLTLYAVIRAYDAADASAASARTRWQVAAVVASALGMLCKEVMVVAPVIVLCYARAFRGSSWRAVLREQSFRRMYAGIAASAGIAIAFVAASVRGHSVGFDLGVSWYEYLWSQAWAVPHYLRLLAWPAGLTFDYGELPIPGLAPLPGSFVLLAGLALTVYAWRRPAARWAAFLATSFFVVIAPSSSVVPIRTEVAAERRVYLASAAIVVLAVVAGLALLRRRGVPQRVQRVVLGALALTLGVTALANGHTYGDPVRLYGAVVANAPGNARGHLGLGLALMESGEEHAPRAAAEFRNALALDSRNFVAALALGWNELGQNHDAAAHDAFAGALRLRPDNPDARRGVARSFLELGHPDSAAMYVDVASEHDIDLLWDLGAAFTDAKHYDAALPYLSRAAVAEPHAVGIALLSEVLARTGHADSAVVTAARAVRSAGDTVNAYVYAALAMHLAGRPDSARRYAEEALARKPDSPQLREVLRELLPR